MFVQKRDALFKYRYILFFVMAGLPACNQDTNGNVAGFSSIPQEFTVKAPTLNEASGIADSKANPGYLWVQQDSGNPPAVELLQHDGAWLKSIHLANIINRDWEDMALSAGPKPDKQYLYIAETGDNLMVHSDYAIYRLIEPAAATDTVQQIDRIAFFYPDGSHNA